MFAAAIQLEWGLLLSSDDSAGAERGRELLRAARETANEVGAAALERKAAELLEATRPMVG